jgi:hypothetical protein
MFTKPAALVTRIRAGVRHLLAPPSRSPDVLPAAGTAGNPTAVPRPARSRSAPGRMLAAAAATATVAASLVAVAGPVAAVSLGGVLNLPEIAVEGPGNSLDYYYQSAPGSWQEYQVPGGGPGTTYSAPSLVQVDASTTVIAVEGPSNSLRYYEQSGGTWHMQQVATAGTTFSAPSVAGVGGGSWRIAAEGPGNSLYFYHPGFLWGWAGQQVAGPGMTYSAPSLAWTGLGLGIAAEGAGNSLDFYTQATSGAWTPQQAAQAAGPGTAFSAPSLAQLGGLGIAVEGPSDSLMLYTHANGPDTWHPQQIGGPHPAYSAPSLAHLAVPNGRFTEYFTAIAVEGPVGFLNLFTQGPGTASPWVNWAPGGMYSTWSAPSLAQINGTTGIAVQGPSNRLDYYSQPTMSGLSWNIQHVAGTGTTFG